MCMHARMCAWVYLGSGCLLSGGIKQRVRASVTNVAAAQSDETRRATICCPAFPEARVTPPRVVECRRAAGVHRARYMAPGRSWTAVASHMCVSAHVMRRKVSQGQLLHDSPSCILNERTPVCECLRHEAWHPGLPVFPFVSLVQIHGPLPVPPFESA